MMGVMMSFGQLGIIGGPLIGGALTQYASWRWCMSLLSFPDMSMTNNLGFYINLPIGGVSAALLFAIKIPETLVKVSGGNLTAKSVLSQLDLLGFSLFAPFSIMILMALQWGGQEYPWSSPTIIGLLCGGVGAFIVFLFWEWYIGEKAMIPFSILRKRVVWSSCLVIALFFGSLLIFSYYLPIYFQTVKGASPTMSGVYMLPSVLSQMAMSVISGVLGMYESLLLNKICY
jgi:MFS family permease